MSLFRKKTVSEEDYYLASQWKLMGRKLSKHKLARVSMTVLAVLYIIALFANFIAPQGLTEYDSRSKDLKPTVIHMWDTEKNFHGPFVYGFTTRRDPVTFEKVFKEDPNKIYKIRFFVQGEEYRFLGIIPCSLHLFGVEEGGRLFIMGSDSMGRDLFSRLV